MKQIKTVIHTPPAVRQARHMQSIMCTRSKCHDIQANTQKSAFISWDVLPVKLARYLLQD